MNIHSSNARHLAGVLSVTSSLLLAGIAHAHEERHDGAPFVLAEGSARTFMVMSADHNTPLAVGVGISETAMASVMALHGADLSMPLPLKAEGIPLDHVYLNWMPHGHPPAGLFTVPHFDVHFYMVDEAARTSILPDDPEFITKGSAYPAEHLVPAGYIAPPEPDPVPQMGYHLIDSAADIFEGKPFTEVFIYGGWNGEVTFFEPMITHEVFMSKESLSQPIKQPEGYARAGWYPTQYTISFDAEAREHRVTLENFVWRDVARQ